MDGGRAEHLLSGEQEAPGALVLRARPPHLVLQLGLDAHDQPAAEARQPVDARLHRPPRAASRTLYSHTLFSFTFVHTRALPSLVARNWEKLSS